MSDQLNPPHGSQPDGSQRAFCDSSSQAVRLLAPAGCGKTLSLLWRCRNLALSGAERHRALIITFTRAARDELVRRINADEAFAQVRSKVEIRTLNAWGQRRIKRLARSTKLLVTGAARHDAIQHILRSVCNNHAEISRALSEHPYQAPKVLMKLIDEFKKLGFVHREHVTIDAFRSHLEWLALNGLEAQVRALASERGDLVELGLLSRAPRRDRMLEEIFERFYRFWIDACDHMIESAVYTLEDQKYWALMELSGHLGGGGDEAPGLAYQQVLVDEFQDINALDLKLIRAIVEASGAGLSIVGDDDQAIYEWRAATPRFILDPQRYFDRRFESHTLDTNYRSPANIVELSQRLIRHNANRVPKHTRAHSAARAELQVWSSPSLTRTIDYVIAEVRSVLARSRDSGERIAIIGRKRSQIIPYQVVLASNDIPFCAAEDLQLFLSKAFNELKELLILKTRAGLRRTATEVVTDLMVMCNKVKRYPLSRSDREQLRGHLLSRRPRELREAVEALTEYRGSLKWKNQGGEMSAEFGGVSANFLGARTVSESILEISRGFEGLRKDYGKSLEDVFYTDPPFLHLSDYAERYGDDLPSFIEDMEKAVETLVQLPSDDDDSNAGSAWESPVHLMTALRAKGKEFDTVVILDVNDGIWPSQLATSEQELEQERRLFYVAMTRARRRLVMISNQSMLGKDMSESPYLKELGLGTAPLPQHGPHGTIAGLLPCPRTPPEPSS